MRGEGATRTEVVWLMNELARAYDALNRSPRGSWLDNAPGHDDAQREASPARLGGSAHG